MITTAIDDYRRFFVGEPASLAADLAEEVRARQEAADIEELPKCRCGGDVVEREVDGQHEVACGRWRCTIILGATPAEARRLWREYRKGDLR